MPPRPYSSSACSPPTCRPSGAGSPSSGCDGESTCERGGAMAERSRPGTSPPPESAGPFASSWRRRHLTVDERNARGLAARQEAPRSSHGRWEPAPDRPDPVTLLEQQGLDGVTRDYYVRQFHDWKGSADVETLLVTGATLYARLCGATLARAHARWGDRIAIAAYLGKGDTFDRAIADFSAAYADQNERDYAAFAAAVDSGRLVARTGV